MDSSLFAACCGFLCRWRHCTPHSSEAWIRTSATADVCLQVLGGSQQTGRTLSSVFVTLLIAVWRRNARSYCRNSAWTCVSVEAILVHITCKHVKQTRPETLGSCGTLRKSCLILQTNTNCVIFCLINKDGNVSGDDGMFRSDNSGKRVSCSC